MSEARILRADRSQLSWDLIDLDALLPSDHRARIVWQFAETLDLGSFYDAIRSRDGVAGRPAADPRVLLALWLYATVEGVGSARELARLVGRDVAYRWLAGGVPVNHHGLADFRVGFGAALDRLLAESVTALVSEGIVTLDEVAVDGTKVRAPAAAGSFTRGGRLDRIETEATARIAALKAEVESDPAAGSKRQRAAQARAANAALDKAAKARAALDELRAEKAARARSHARAEAAKGEPSVSLTDLEARRMRFHDGAVRAGYNLQTAAVPDAGIIVAVVATDRRNDKGLLRPIVEALGIRYGRVPQRVLVDNGYPARGMVDALANHPKGAVALYMPVPQEKPLEALTASGRAARRRRQRRMSPAEADWRARMATEEGQAVFGRRKLIERLHAQYKNRGLGRLTVTGLIKTHAVLLWHALANNLMAAHRLRTANA